MNTKNLRRLVAILSLGLAAAACGGSGDPAAESDTGDSPADTASDLDIITLEPGDSEVKAVTISALGGIRFDRPVETGLLVIDDFVLVTQRVGNSDTLAHILLTSQLFAGSKVDNVESYLDVIKLTHDVNPTGTAIVVAGVELAGYEITGDESVQSFASSRFPAPAIAGGGPLEYTLSFIGETPSGVLDVGVDGLTSEEAQAMLPALGTMLASLEFTGPGLDPALPPGEVIEPAEPGPPPPPAEGADDAAIPPLGPPFSSVEPGRYELLNFGLPISLDFGEEWAIQPNFPGVIVVTDPTSIGPNDRDLIFVNSIAELVPLAGGPLVAGDAIPIGDIEELLSNPPEPMQVSDVERTVLEAENGSTTPVVSFTIEMVGDHACSPSDPCELGFVTAYGFVNQLRPMDTQRVWWFPEHPHGPAAIIVSAGEDSVWMERAEELMATLELSR